MNKQLIIITFILALSAFAVSAAPYSNTYQVNSRGYGFDARSFSQHVEADMLFSDIFQDTQKTNINQNSDYQNNVVNANVYQNNHQGIQGYQRNLVESYGTCEPGEQTYNSKAVITKLNYPVQRSNHYQKRGIQKTIVRQSGCDGRRYSLQESTNFQDNFDIKDMRLQTQQLQEKNTFDYEATSDFNRRYMNTQEVNAKTTIEQDRFMPFNGRRAILNNYYPYTY